MLINNKIMENDDKIITIRIFNNFNDNDNDNDNDDNNNNNNKMIIILLLLEHSYSQMTGQWQGPTPEGCPSKEVFVKEELTV